MNPTRVITPNLRLSQAIRAPGGRTIDEAVAETEAGAGDLAAFCEVELSTLLGAAETALLGLTGQGGETDDAGLRRIYATARQAIGGGSVCGRPALDEALSSLCDLTQKLLRIDSDGRDAIVVHLNAWRLMLRGAPTRDGIEAVLQGLAAVRGRYEALPDREPPEVQEVPEPRQAQG